MFDYTDYTKIKPHYSALESQSLPLQLRELLLTPIAEQTPAWAKLVIERTFELFDLNAPAGQSEASTSCNNESHLEDWQQRAVSRLRRLHAEVEWEPHDEMLRDKLRAILFAQLQTLLQQAASVSSYQESA